MKRVAILAAVAALAAPGVFAQSAVTSSTGAPVSSGTGAVVTQASPSPAPAVAAEPAMVSTPTPHLLSGGTIVQHSSTTTMGAAGPATTKTIVTHSWANVPANAERRGDFQRWQKLK
jgi:hypothetical protein